MAFGTYFDPLSIPTCPLRNLFLWYNRRLLTLVQSSLKFFCDNYYSLGFQWTLK